VTRIEELITELVQGAPALDAGVIAELVAALRVKDAPLARSIAQVIELVGNRTVDAGIALPALAMACGTLVDPRLTEREHEAARFEIETLLPVPEGSKQAQPIAAPDVPLARLTRPRRA
jgi:hypothetical protein